MPMEPLSLSTNNKDQHTPYQRHWVNPFMPTSTFLYIFSRKIKSHQILAILGRVHVWYFFIWSSDGFLNLNLNLVDFVPMSVRRTTLNYLLKALGFLVHVQKNYKNLPSSLFLGINGLIHYMRYVFFLGPLFFFTGREGMFFNDMRMRNKDKSCDSSLREGRENLNLAAESYVPAPPLSISTTLITYYKQHKSHYPPPPSFSLPQALMQIIANRFNEQSFMHWECMLAIVT